jgi:hypothetical protein
MLIRCRRMKRLAWVCIVGVIGSACSSRSEDVATADGGGTSVATGGTEDDTADDGTDPTTGGTRGSTTTPDETTDADGGSEDSTGPMLCDDLDVCSACRACAVESDCADEHTACASDEACAQLVECVNECKRDDQGDVCEDACFASHPGGHALALELHQCLVMACPNSCG